MLMHSAGTHVASANITKLDRDCIKVIYSAMNVTTPIIETLPTTELNIVMW